MTKKKLPKQKTLTQWLDKLEKQHNKKIDLGLKRIQQVYENLKLNKIAKIIITVAGTNGKGSTVAILSAIYQQAGFKVGAFTSPHILTYNERIKINNQPINDEEIIAAFVSIEKKLSAISLSYFEYSTLAAAIIFKNHNVDVAVLEVGLGGRLDSVNVIDTDCAIITTIDIDHISFLGNDRESIGFEKAGIMRKNKPIICGDRNCPQSIIDHANKTQAQLLFPEAFDAHRYALPNVNGQYQLLNASTAIKSIQSLQEYLKVSDQDINMGLQNIKLSGRLEFIAKSPDIIVDVSHNKQAADTLSRWLTKTPISGQTIAVFAVLEDKNPIDWLHYFQESIDVWCISQVQSERTLSSRNLLKLLSNTGRLILSFESVIQAFEKAKVIADPEDRIIVFGSFYTVSEVIQIQACA